MKPLYKRLGLRARDLSTKWEAERLNRIPKIMQERPRDIPIYKVDYVYTTNFIALNKYYLDERREAIKYAHLMVDYTIEYFFGNWRSEEPIDEGPPDEERRKKYGTWTDEFREAIFWASCLGQWEKVKKLAQYPTDECPIGRCESKLFCYWLLTLAAVLRGEPLENVEEYTNKVANSRRKYYTTMLSMLESILDKDSVKFNKLLKEHLDHCNKTLFCPQPVSKREIQKVTLFIDIARAEGIDVKVPQEYAPIPVSITDRVARDGTFLINFARHKGLEVEIPEQYVDRIVVLKESERSLVNSNAQT